MKYFLESLYDIEKEMYNEEAIDYFTKSKLDNEVFLTHLIKIDNKDFSKHLIKIDNNTFLKSHIKDNSVFFEKGIWYAFAQIIIRRGLPKINDVKEIITKYLIDFNIPGSTDIDLFIKANYSEFRQSIVKSIKFAYKERDYVWLGNLLALFKSEESLLSDVELTLIDEIIEYIDDDNSRGFKVRFDERFYRMFDNY